MEIRPQKGPQEAFLASPADIVIYGGAAGGGKSYGLLLEAIRHSNNPDFGAVIFRRTYAQVTVEGGIWDESSKIYPLLGAAPNQSKLSWNFKSGASVSFGHLQHEKDKFSYQGASICLIGFDELTHFSQSQFFYMLSRNRSTCGVRPYIRATTNPDADSWVALLISWWIDEEGYPVPERAGVVRWFVRPGDTMIWADSPDELKVSHPDLEAKSLTFIPARLEDNKILIEKDPSYRANLMALDHVERARLLGGNWKIKPSGGGYFKGAWFGDSLEAIPKFTSVCRYWDRAATEPTSSNNPDWTVGVLMGRTPENTYVIIDVERFQGSPQTVESRIKESSRIDQARFGDKYFVGLEVEPGASGKYEASAYTRVLTGHIVRLFPARQDKITRARPCSSQVEHGNVRLMGAYWNRDYIRELEAFPNGANDDQVDATSGAFNALSQEQTDIDALMKGMGHR